MAVLNEAPHAGEFLVSEANGHRSREAITVLSGEDLAAGAVLGKVTTDVADIAIAAVAGNTGNGVASLHTTEYAAGVKPGVYRATCIEPATNAGKFAVEDPDGIEIGIATVAVLFDGVVKFTIADGGTDFVAGDAFTVTVAAGSGKYKEYDPSNDDGSQVAVAILYDAVDASLADAAGVAIVRDAEVNSAELTWFSGADANQKAAGLADLALSGIIGR